jgi:hypothetical protein
MLLFVTLAELPSSIVRSAHQKDAGWSSQHRTVWSKELLLDSFAPDLHVAAPDAGAWSVATIMLASFKGSLQDR